MRRRSGILSLASVLAVTFGTVSIQPCYGQDTLSIGSATGITGSLVTVPVHLVDRYYSPLGADRGDGNQIQGFAMQLAYDHPEAITAVSISRSGALASKTPLYETTRAIGNTTSYVASFDEQRSPIRGIIGNGSDIATISLLLSDQALIGTQIALSFVSTTTMLSNQAGTVGESANNGGITLSSGVITVAAGAKATVVIIKTVKAKASERGTIGRIRVTRTGSTARALKVALTLGGAAKSGKDYQRLASSVTIPARKASVDIAVVAIKDKAKEKAKTMTVTVKSAKSYLIMAPGSAAVSITD